MSDQNGRGSEAGGRQSFLPRLGGDLGTRVVWGVAMGVVGAAALFSGKISFDILVLVVTVLLSWEWGRLVHGREASIVIAVHIGAAAFAAGLAALGFVGLGLLALPIGAILAMLLSLGGHSVFAALGVFYAGLPAVTIIWLRADAIFGLRAAVFLILVVVLFDTAAFLSGRFFGGPRLLPRVSPNKTWAGLIGGVLASVLGGALFSFAVSGSSPLRLAATAAILALMAQAGDLVESAIKRRFGAKDTSSLIPGHGGVMDRVDGLVIAASAAGLAGFFVDAHLPARALLLGY